MFGPAKLIFEALGWVRSLLCVQVCVNTDMVFIQSSSPFREIIENPVIESLVINLTLESVFINTISY